MDQALERVVADPAFGTKTKLAKFLGVSVAAVSQWKQVPMRHASRIELETEGRVTCREMRPDVFLEPQADKLVVEAAQ